MDLQGEMRGRGNKGEGRLFPVRTPSLWLGARDTPPFLALSSFQAPVDATSTYRALKPYEDPHTGPSSWKKNKENSRHRAKDGGGLKAHFWPTCHSTERRVALPLHSPSLRPQSAPRTGKEAGVSFGIMKRTK